MIIDLVFIALLVLALVQGYRRGLIVAIFSLVSIIVGLAAAIKLSSVVANHLGTAVKISDKWLPVISFAIVFIIVVILVRLGAKAIQRLTETLLLGWANKLGGIILYVALYTTVFSVVIFYADQINLIRAATLQASVTYPFIRPWGPKAIDGLAAILPFFKDMFRELEQFFQGISEKMPAK
jgi:membrane protein required for colicin V production